MAYHLTSHPLPLCPSSGVHNHDSGPVCRLHERLEPVLRKLCGLFRALAEHIVFGGPRVADPPLLRHDPVHVGIHRRRRATRLKPVYGCLPGSIVRSRSSAGVHTRARVCEWMLIPCHTQSHTTSAF